MNRFTTTPSAMEMSQALYHPPHVAEALDSIEGLEGDELKAAIRYRGSTSSQDLPDEALIRIIRARLGRWRRSDGGVRAEGPYGPAGRLGLGSPTRRSPTKIGRT